MQENIVKKIDDSYRVLIPVEIRDKLNLTKGQEVELSINKNKHIVIKPRSIKVEEEIKTEDDLLEEEPVVIPSKEERISSKIIDKKKPKAEVCYKCGATLEEGNRLRLNGRKICKSCTDNLKKDLLYRIYLNNKEKASKEVLEDLD